MTLNKKREEERRGKTSRHSDFFFIPTWGNNFLELTKNTVLKLYLFFLGKTKHLKEIIFLSP
jgi:hypothetical protein